MSLEYLWLLDCTCTTWLNSYTASVLVTSTGECSSHLTGRSWSYLKALRHRIEHQCPSVTAGENHQGQEDSSTYRSACHQAPNGGHHLPCSTVHHEPGPPSTDLYTCVPRVSASQCLLYEFPAGWCSVSGFLSPDRKKCKGYLSTATNWGFLIIARKAVEAPMEQPPLPSIFPPTTSWLMVQA